jgi:capsular exopolysaccharide synthesis family protein
MDIKQVGRILWKRRGWLAAPLVVVTGLAALVVWLVPPTYQASAKLLLESRDRALAAIGADAAESSQLTSLTRTGSPLETEMEVLKSDPIVNRVIMQLDLQHPTKHRQLEPGEFLARGKVTVLKATDILEVAYSSTDPGKAQRITNAWVGAFLDDNRAAGHQAAAKATAFLQEQLGKTRTDLTKAEQDLLAYKQAHGAVDVAEESHAYIQDLTALEADLRQAEASQREAQMQASALQAKIGLSAQQAMAATTLAQSDSMRTLRERLVATESNPNLGNARLQPDHPEVKALQAQAATLRRQLTEKAAELLGRELTAGEASAELDPIRQGLTQDLIKAQVAAYGAQTRADALRTLASRAKARLARLPGQSYELTRLERNAQILSDRYKLLHKRLDEARINDASDTGNVRVVELAGYPLEPSSLRKLPRLGLGALAGLLLGLGLAFGREYLDDSLKTVEEAEPLLGMSLGMVPWHPRADQAVLPAHLRPQSSEAQAYRNLAFNLGLIARSNAPRAYVFSSAGPGEGKTTTVANLGVALAQAGKRVLVVDADMRRPALHASYALGTTAGLSSVLSGACVLADVVQRGPHPDLHVIGAGPLPSNPEALLGSEAFDRLLEIVCSHYDVVLFDAPPLLAVPDARIIAGRLGGLIYVARLGKVSRRASQQVLGLMRASNLPVLGSVLHGLKPHVDGFYDAYVLDYGREPAATC